MGFSWSRFGFLRFKGTIPFPPQGFPLPKIHVLNPNGDKLYDVGRPQADRMLAAHQAKYTADRRCLRLTGLTREHEHLCRTHTSRGGPLGGQQYTYKKRGQVTGFKRIFPEDLAIFQSAIRECLTGWKLDYVFIGQGASFSVYEAKHV